MEFDYKTQWKMRDGSVINMSDMADSHLLNTINMLDRQLIDIQSQSSMAYSTIGSIQGEMAQDSMWDEIDTLMDKEMAKIIKKSYLESEAIRRGLLSKTPTEQNDARP